MNHYLWDFRLFGAVGVRYFLRGQLQSSCKLFLAHLAYESSWLCSVNSDYWGMVERALGAGDPALVTSLLTTSYGTYKNRARKVFVAHYSSN